MGGVCDRTADEWSVTSSSRTGCSRNAHKTCRTSVQNTHFGRSAVSVDVYFNESRLRPITGKGRLLERLRNPNVRRKMKIKCEDQRVGDEEECDVSYIFS